MSAPQPEQSLLDLNGRQVRAFASKMPRSAMPSWPTYWSQCSNRERGEPSRTALGATSSWRASSTDFLTQQGVRRDDVMNGVRDIETKARLEAHMDERKTGEDGYRRRIVEVRAANPARPSRPIEPFGYTKTEAKALTNGRAGSTRPERPAWNESSPLNPTGGETTRKPSDLLSRTERLRRFAVRLRDEDLESLIERPQAGTTPTPTTSGIARVGRDMAQRPG